MELTRSAQQSGTTYRVNLDSHNEVRTSPRRAEIWLSTGRIVRHCRVSHHFIRVNFYV